MNRECLQFLNQLPMGDFIESFSEVKICHFTTRVTLVVRLIHFIEDRQQLHCGWSFLPEPVLVVREEMLSTFIYSIKNKSFEDFRHIDRRLIGRYIRRKHWSFQWPFHLGGQLRNFRKQLNYSNKYNNEWLWVAVKPQILTGLPIGKTRSPVETGDPVTFCNEYI